MTVNYTSLLGLALPVTGTEAGAWGDVVNNYLTSYLDASVAGTQTITGSQTAVTLSVTNGATLVTVGSGATGSAQFQIITCTGNPASLLTITAPASSRQYIIINSTSTSQSVKIVGAGPTTGVTIVSGEKAHVAWNGSDFVKIATQSGTGEFVTVDTTNLEVTNIKAKDGTASMTLADSTGIITLSATAGTANGVAYLNGSRALTTGSALTFDGTKLGVGVASAQAGVDIANSGLWSSGNIYNYPAGNAFVKIQGVAAQNNWIGIAGSYGQTTGSANLLLQANFNNTTQQAGHYIGSEAQSATSSDLTFGSITGGVTTGTNATKNELMRLTSTGLKSSIAGTNADPVFSYTSDTNTGIFFPAADKLGFTAGGGSDQMVLTSTGLGIGTSSPGYKLTVRVSGATTTLDGLSVSNGTASSIFQVTGATYSYRGVGSNNLWIGTDGGNDMYIGPSTANVIKFGSSAFEYMRLDISGNLGLGVTPSASTIAQFEGGSNLLLVGRGNAYLSNNATFNSGFKYINTATAGQYNISGSVHSWFTAASGTAGFPITFSQAMTLDASGNLLVGTTSANGILAASGRGYIEVNGTTDSAIGFESNNTLGGYLYNSATEFRVANYSNNPLTFHTNNTERARITSGGNLCVGSTSSTYRLGVTTNSGGGIQVVTAGATTGNPSQDWYDSTNLTEATLTTGNSLISFGSYTNTPLALITNNTERARITSGGVFVIKSDGTNASNLANKRTTSVGTGATTISLVATSYGQLVMVTGIDGGNIFSDLIFTSITAGPTVISAKSVSGTPASRTYTMSGDDLQLAMGSGSYDVRCTQFTNL